MRLALRSFLVDLAPVTLSVLSVAFLCHAEPTTPPDHAPGYQQTTWATVHGTSKNDDYVPLAMTTRLEPRWHVLQGAGIWTAPSVASDGTIYTTTGQGKGTSHLHAFTPDGKLLWESAPQESLDDLDSAAVMSAAVIDDQGNVYVGDVNQLWAFYPGGEIKWVSSLAEHGISAPFVTAMLCGNEGQYVGGISADGKVILFLRSDGSLAMPVLDLPGEPNPPGILPKGLWAGGLIAPDTLKMTWDVLLGQSFEVANSPAVHPSTGRIFITAAGKNQDHGVLYGIDVTASGLQIAFAADVPPESGTSPALSPDGTKIYAMGGGGSLFAVDTQSGELLWSVETNGQDASPSVSPDNTIYVLGGDKLVAVSGEDGSIVWRADYSEFAASKQPKVWTRFGLIENDGLPEAFVDSVVTIVPNTLWTTLLVGYPVNLFGKHFIHAVETYLVALDPKDGSIQAEYPIPDTSEGGISVSKHGDLYLDLLAAQASIAHYAGYQFLLPRSAQRPKPVAGLIAFSPVSQREQAIAGITWAQSLLDSPSGRLRIQRADSQLRASAESVALALANGELNADTTNIALALMHEAQQGLATCLQETAPCENLEEIRTKLRDLKQSVLH